MGYLNRFVGITGKFDLIRMYVQYAGVCTIREMDVSLVYSRTS